MERELDPERLARPENYEVDSYSNAAAAPGWTRAEPHVVGYLRACGVADENCIALILARVRGRISSRKAMRYDDDPVALAIRETIALIDDWVASELGLDRSLQRHQICEARAVLIRGEAGDWARELVASRHGRLADELNRRFVPPLPARAPLNMPTQAIGLRYFGIRRQLLKMIVRISAPFGRRR